MSRVSRRIVIDASIGRAAGKTQHPVSRACREFMEQVLMICHQVVMTADIREEWKEHRSNFSATWLASMTARKKVITASSAPPAEIVELVNASDLTENQKKAILKDLRLVEAALATDSTVASLDETVRALLREFSKRCGRIRPVVWVNPAKEEENLGSWLSAGAPSEKVRLIGFGQQ